MAAHHEDRTEAPTPRRRYEARSKGQVARSHDLTAATVLVAAFATLYVVGPGLWGVLLVMVQLALAPDAPTSPSDLSPLAGTIGLGLIRSVGPFLAILFVTGLVVLFAQVGWLFTLQPLTPSLSRINPVNGLLRWFSARSVMAAVVGFAKVVLVGVVAYAVLVSGSASLTHAFVFGSSEVVAFGARMVFELGMKLAAALLVLALLDYAWQRYRHERDLRMTKEEVKDELRSMEGDPNVKRRRRQIQLQLALRRLKKDVPKADVVVTNPEHLAVAIAYDARRMAAPRVIAKGADYMALRIRQIAEEYGIPLVERRPLAWALYEAVEVGQYIPEHLYRAVAEVLAYIYELGGRSEGVQRELAEATA